MITDPPPQSFYRYQCQIGLFVIRCAPSICRIFPVDFQPIKTMFSEKSDSVVDERLSCRARRRERGERLWTQLPATNSEESLQFWVLAFQVVHSLVETWMLRKYEWMRVEKTVKYHHKISRLRTIIIIKKCSIHFELIFALIEGFVLIFAETCSLLKV